MRICECDSSVWINCLKGLAVRVRRDGGMAIAIWIRAVSGAYD